jgi:hypothetical protein
MRACVTTTYRMLLSRFPTECYSRPHQTRSRMFEPTATAAVTGRALWQALARSLLVATLLCAPLMAVQARAQALGHTQIGSLPRPGLFTFFRLADTSKLRPSPDEGIRDDRPFPKRGIIYTKRAGFVDLAHVYNTVLRANDASNAVAAALRQDQDSIRLPRFESSEVSILFSSSPVEATIAGAASEQSIQAVSRMTGECIANELGVWHEITTWFGYKTTRIWSEKPSAFTYEDTVSHLVGIQVFEAIPGKPDRAKFASALRRVLDSLGLVDRKSAAEAVHSVKGLWWGPLLYTRRMLDIGEKDGTVHPWVVPGAQPDLHDDRGPLSFTVPCAKMANGYAIHIVPSASILRHIRKSAPKTPAVIDPRREFPILVDVIRAEVRQQLGDNAISPN